MVNILLFYQHKIKLLLPSTNHPIEYLLFMKSSDFFIFTEKALPSTKETIHPQPYYTAFSLTAFPPR